MRIQFDTYDLSGDRVISRIYEFTDGPVMGDTVGSIQQIALTFPTMHGSTRAQIVSVPLASRVEFYAV
jgi:hypothetical protein